MNPELITAIKERIKIGHSRSEVHSELEAAGYDDETIEQAYTQANSELNPLSEHNQNSAEGTSQSDNVQHEFVGLGELISEAWSLTKLKAKTFLLSGLLMVLILAAISFIIVMTMAGSLMEISSSLSSMGSSSGSFSLLIFIVFQLVAFVLFRVINFSVLRNLVSKDSGETFMGSLSWTFARVIPVLILGVLIMLASQGGYLLLIIPGIALSIYLMFSSFVYAVEGKSGISAMIRSTELVHGHWWGILGRILLAGIVSSLIMFLPMVLLGLIGSGVMASVGDSGAIAISLLFGISFWVAMSMGIGYLFSASTVMFNSLRLVASANAFSDGRKKKLKTFYWIVVVLGVLAMISQYANSAPSPMQSGIQAPQMQFESSQELKNRAIELRQEG